MSILSRLFGGGGGKSGSTSMSEPELYKEFRIFAEPQKGAGGYRIAARIEREVDGEMRVYHLVRADTVQSLDEAEQFSVRKARQVIDERGAHLFD